MSFISEIKEHPAFRELPKPFKRWLALRFLFGKKPEKMGDKYFLSMHLPLFPSEAFDRFLWDQVKISRGERVLEIASVEVTRRCGMDCMHCAFPRSGLELSASQLRKILEEIRTLGPYSYIITGGDPLKRDDLESIVAPIKGEGAINIFTPGYGLTVQRAEKLRKAGITGIFIGIDSPYEDRNDEIKGRNGAFKKAIQSVENSLKAGLLTGISAVIMPDSDKKEIKGIIDLGMSLGVHEIDFFEPISQQKGLHGSGALIKELFRVQKRAKKKWPVIISGPYMDSPEFMGCTAGFNRIHVDYRGNITPCSVMPYVVGSALESPVKELWGKTYRMPGSKCLAKECISKGIEGKECVRMDDKGVPRYYGKLMG